MKLDNISVVVPAFNAADWLPKTIPKIEAALKQAKVKTAEIIIVDDGSTDGTGDAARALKTSYPKRIVVRKTNTGRFLSRCAGVDVAKYENMLLIDTRVFIGKDSLLYIAKQLEKSPEERVWTGHVIIDRTGNPYARFWEGLTFIAWRHYFRNPRLCSYGIKDFDRYPKGTTCFFAPTEVIRESNSWFKLRAKNRKAANDDTPIIRHIAEKQNINLSPEYYCTYHARTNLKQYCKHAHHRGKVFVDGFLRRDGNRFFWPLVTFLVLSILVPIGLVIFPQYLLACLAAAGAAWLLELLAALGLGVPYKDAFSLWLLSPLFAVVYGLGIWRAVFDIYVLRTNR